MGSGGSSGNEGRGLVEDLERIPSSREVQSFRCDPYLWNLFRERCKNLGLSTCSVLEQLIRAWITGEDTRIPKSRPMTVNMTVNYQVERPRRGAPEQPSEDQRLRCYVCGSPDIYGWRPEFTEFLEVRCKKCRAKYFIEPGSKKGTR